MKNIFNRILLILLLIAILGQISDWFFNYSEEVKSVLSTMMFTLIGVCYIVWGYRLKNDLVKIIIIVGGVYLIVMNFIYQSTLAIIVGIVCVITPMLLAKFTKYNIYKIGNT